MVAGVVGNLLSYWRLPTPSLGASGSLFGLVGAGIVLPLRYRHLIAEEARSTILRQLVTVAAINFAISFSPGIDIWAHLGGFIGGGVAALFLMPPVLDDRPPSALRDAALTVVTLLVLGVTLLAGLLQWRVAGRDAQEDTVNYIVADYWTVGIPARWQTRTVPGSAGLWWITPDRATLNIRDIPHRPDLNLTRQAWSQMGVVQPITIDGRNALTMGRQTNDGTEYLCVISAYDHEIDIAIDSSPAGYQDAHDDYERILSSIHVLHPPPPTAPNVATGSGLAVPDSSTP
jgi:rhomboid protease GluP